MKIIIELIDAKESPNGKSKVLCNISWKGKPEKTNAQKIAMKAIDLIDTERRKL